MDAESGRAVPPLNFGELLASDFVAWLVTVQKGKGKSPQFSTFNNDCAAFVVEQTANGQVSIKVGKYPLDPEVYEFLCIHMLTSCSKDMAFARAFLVIT
ncbi:hypothetical protein P43SY_010708 [Pythium insidiosum]|uniref:Uncharacterized protein n=1 Tax=Pythium insidiosum TaxID=114742 RepID=A0AAD5Q5G0_PYTIN|nr:hypothetical protein P43SY_010708 [Pythium insidiosum]